MNLLKVLILSTLFVISATAEPHDTNAILPNDKTIGSGAKVVEAPNQIKVKATFVKSETIASYNQGNWVRYVMLVTYKVTEEHPEFKDDLITFIAKNYSSAEGSGIRMKQNPWPFNKGDKTFTLEKDSNIKFRDYYKILKYTS